MRVYDRSRAAHFDVAQGGPGSSANALNRPRDAEPTLARLIAVLDTHQWAIDVDANLNASSGFLLLPHGDPVTCE